MDHAGYIDYNISLRDLNLGHLGDFPLKTIIPGFGRTGFGRDEIYPNDPSRHQPSVFGANIPPLTTQPKFPPSFSAPLRIFHVRFGHGKLADLERAEALGKRVGYHGDIMGIFGYHI